MKASFRSNALRAGSIRLPIQIPAQRRRHIVVRASEDQVLRSLSADAELAVLVCDCKQLVQEAMDRHNTAPTATAALGRALIGAVLLGVYRREDEGIQLNWKGDGPLGGILVTGDHTGQVRGKVGSPGCNIPLKENGKFDVGGAVGQGMLSVIRSHPLEPNPYTGTVPIYNGEIAEDLARYMLDSEQMASALALGVQLNVSDGRVHSAGGYFVQVLPFASDETLEKLEANLKALGSVSHLLAAGNTPLDITRAILDGIGVAEDEPVIMTPRYGPCGEEAMRVRMMKALAALGEEEVDDILKTDGNIEVTCDLCNSTYVFTEANRGEILSLAEELGR